jgi:hypothetical protein
MKVEMCVNEIHIRVVLVGKYRNEIYILSLSLELAKVGGYDFPHPCDDPQNSRLYFKGPIGDIEFDMYAEHSRQLPMGLCPPALSHHIIQQLSKAQEI